MPTWIQPAAILPRLRSLRVRPIDLLFAFCAFLSLRALLTSGLTPLGLYDEGLLFTNAQMMADGRVPYRDFYSNYPPAIFQIVTTVMAFSSQPIWTMRFLSFGVRIATAFGVATLVGRARGRSLCLATASAVLALQTNLGLIPFAYSLAVLLILGIVAAWPAPCDPLWRRLGCGALFGYLSFLRHDLLVYSVSQLLAIEALSWLIHKRSFFFGTARELAEFSIGAVGTALVFWLPVLAQAGLMRTVHDLVLDQTELVAARVLPFPPMFEMVWVEAFDMSIPAPFVDRLRLCLTLTGITVVAAVYGLVRVISTGANPTVRERITVLSTVFAVAALPQILGRTDDFHAAFVMPLMLLAGLRLLGTRVAQAVALIAFLPWFKEGIDFIRSEDALRLWRTDDATFLSEERLRVTGFLRAETKPNEPIFVGCSAHRRIIINPMDVYFWSHRPGATRYMQFDPGLATTAKRQSEMIADLKRSRPRIVLRYGACLWDEPNESMIEGSSLLDDYLSANYAPTDAVGYFEVWRPKAAH